MAARMKYATFMHRRAVLRGTTAVLLATTWPRIGRTQEDGSADAAAEDDAAFAFDFDSLSAQAKKRAEMPYLPPRPTPGLPEGLTYDLYRQIAFDPARALQLNDGPGFSLQAFHLGWLFDVAVPLYEVSGAQARPMAFGAEDFEYRHDAAGTVPEGADLPGVAGFRLHYPMNRADIMDEILTFQGASYFRALGRGNAYGLSARGLAIGTATDQPEEFPRFSEFYLVRPKANAQSITIFAALDSESVSGAFRFVVRPGQETVIDVSARLWFRQDVAHLGVAPLTSMFLYSEANRAAFDDYRPQVHDSDGLQIRRADGDTLWRALNNPPRLSISQFAETSPRGFGLHQRDRSFDSYQDPGARYQDRPSVRVEILGDWGDGAVRLVEIATDLEINDNIVAYWMPDGGAAAGDMREYNYRLRWGMMPPDPDQEPAHVSETRTGKGGVSGVPTETDARKFVVDFKGGILGRMDPQAEVIAQVAVNGGEVVEQVFFKIDGQDVWRLVADVDPQDSDVVELMAHVEGYGQRLSETWLYQWIADA